MTSDSTAGWFRSSQRITKCFGISVITVSTPASIIRFMSEASFTVQTLTRNPAA